MARIRTIKPEFWQNEILARLPAETRLLALALLNHADDHGYFWASVPLVRAACCPFDDDSSMIRRSLDELSNIGWIELRKSIDGRDVGRVVKFAIHQRVDRAKESKIEPIFNVSEQFDDASTNDRRQIDERSTLEQGTGNRDQGTGKESPNGDSCPEVCDPQTPDEKIDEGSVVMVFQTNGNPKTWKLRSTRVEGWKKAYPGVDIDAELLKAEAWLQDNPSRRKTASGMPRFLGSWMSRRQNSGSVGQKGSSKPIEKTWFQRYLDGEVSVDGPMEEAG